MIGFNFHYCFPFLLVGTVIVECKSCFKQQQKCDIRVSLQICHSKSGDINSNKIRTLIAAYVEKARAMRKYEARKAEFASATASSSSTKSNGQKKRK